MNTASQNLAPVEHLPVVTDPMSILAAAVERGVDADQLGKLMDLQERYQANQARVAFATALSEFQSECPRISKSRTADRGKGGQYKFTPLEDIQEAIRPYLAKHGLSVRFTTKTAGSAITAFCFITHSAGHVVENQFEAPVDPLMHANDTQKMGSARSYAKRYSLVDALNLQTGETDDDGYSADTPMITDLQLVQLKADITKYDINVPAFCKILKAATVETIPASKWPQVERMVEAKRKLVESKK